jgi:uncharacterized membrane protein YraQ (UPF0718 family)
MAAGGLVVLGLAFFVNAYLVYIAIGSAVLVAGIVGYLIYKAWRERKNFVQTAKIVEVQRQEATVESDNKVFGVGALPGIVAGIADKTQAAAVKALRKVGIVKEST